MQAGFWSLGHLGTWLDLKEKYFYDTRLSKIGKVFKKVTTQCGDGHDHNLFSRSPAEPMTLGCLVGEGRELQWNSIFMKND